MSLRSGQLIDSAWALDALSILLFDDQTVVFFGLKHVPGLLDAILDHFHCYLHQLFESTSSTSASDPTSAIRSDDVTPAPAKRETSSADRETSSSSATRLPEVNAAQPEVSCQELPLDFSSSRRAQRASSNNYTHRTRCGKSVKVDSTAHAREHLHLMTQPAAASCDVTSDVDALAAANDISTFETLPHVHTHMESHGVAEVLRRRFAAHLFQDDTPTSPTPRISVKIEPSTSDVSAPATSSDTLTSSERVKTEVTATTNSSCSSDSGIVIKTEPTDASDVTEETKTEVKAEDSVDDVSAECVASSDKLFVGRLKRKWEEGNLDDEEYRQDETPLTLSRDTEEEVARRCTCIANILRSLSFIPGNDREMAQHNGLLSLVGRLLLFRHRHCARQQSSVASRLDARDAEAEADETLLEPAHSEWWWPTLDAVREDMLVLLSNISGQMALAQLPESTCMPLLDGLLHWTVCPSTYAHDPMPTMSSNSVLSPKKLMLEALAKLCISESNVDLILAMPPFTRICNLLAVLVRGVADGSDVVVRELSIAILSYLVQGDSSAARAVALQPPSISVLLDFLEAAEVRMQQLLKTHAPMLQQGADLSELLGTSLDMLRKCARTLVFLAQVPDNHNLFFDKQERLLNLVMSMCMDSEVVRMLSEVLFSC